MSTLLLFLIKKTERTARSLLGTGHYGFAKGLSCLIGGDALEDVDA
jgi:hypothetical protein